MTQHLKSMIPHSEIDPSELLGKIRNRKILFGGNAKLKIYGKLNCSSGKQLKKKNRIFFSSEEDAIQAGYRPCGNCMKENYSGRKHGSFR